MPSRSPRLVVTLVHGTFANESASWMQNQSELRRVIEAEYKDRVVVKTFGWSGGNSHEARLEAADKLTEVLKNTFQQFPDERHFVIAHSHGGNITLYAARDETVRFRLSGALFIATPFIHCKKRDVLQTVGFLINTATVVTLLLILFAVWKSGVLSYLSLEGVRLFMRLTKLPKIGRWIAALLSIPLIILMLPVYFVRESMVNKMSGWGETSQSSTVNKIATCNVDELPFPVYCAIAMRDEARLGLKLLRWLSAIPHYFWMPITQGLILGGLITFGILFFMLAPSPVSSDATLWTYVQGLKMILFYTLALYAAVFVIMLCLPIFIRSHRLGFGTESIVDNLFTDIFVESLPQHSKSQIKTKSFFEIAIPENLLSKEYLIEGKGLKHSLIYSDGNFMKDLKALVEWAIEKEEGNSGKTGGVDKQSD